MTAAMPYGAKEIAELRTGGKRPAHMVLLSLMGPLREANPIVIAKPERAYDWRFLVGLDVLVVANAGTDKPAIKRLLDDLLKLPTDYLGLWLADRQTGINIARGKWCMRPGALRSMSSYERELFKGIGQAREAVPCM